MPAYHSEAVESESESNKMPEVQQRASSESERPPTSIGVVAETSEYDRNLVDLCKEYAGQEFEFVCYYFCGKDRRSWDPEWDSSPDAVPPPISVVDAQMRSENWSTFVCGRVSPWIDLDHCDQRIRELSVKALNEELDYAMYLGLRGVAITLKHDHSPQLAALLTHRLWTNGDRFRVWIVLPTSRARFSGHSVNGASGDGNNVTDVELWQIWFNFRKLVFNHQLLAVCLRLTADLDDEFIEPNRLDRWVGELVACIWVDQRMFVSIDGQPSMPPSHAYLIKKLAGQLQMIISGGWDLRSYRECCDRLCKDRPRVKNTIVEGYEDHLQVPLQPLSDNLDSSTYETFEKDPVKYVEYHRAVHHAFVAMARKRYAQNKDDPVKLVVMVLGAGRGPLVSCCLKAHQQIEITDDQSIPPFSLKLYAVEKNKNALITLGCKNSRIWGDRVTVVGSDMRYFVPDEKADIIVSELLGSFGDNELSPECLDGAMHLIKSDAISIPYKYTSYLAPIHSVKLFNTIRSHADDPWHANLMRRTLRPPFANPLNAPFVTDGQSVGQWHQKMEDLFDQPYVVKLHKCHMIAHAKPLFTFKHPNWSAESRERSGVLEFEATENTELMGFSGYFDCHLYEDIRLSIEPSTHSHGMFSWFPVLFPLRRLVTLKKGEKMKIKMERKTDEGGVWYEWALLEPSEGPVQNVNASSYYMRLA